MVSFGSENSVDFFTGAPNFFKKAGSLSSIAFVEAAFVPVIPISN
jgi:poly(A) polymerase Pap1